MSDRYFMMFGSPGRAQVRGPHRCDHHASWVELISLYWVQPHAGNGGAGKTVVSELDCLMRASAASQELQLYGTAGGAFDLVVLDIWDDSTQKSKGKFELRDVMMRHYSTVSDAEGPMVGFRLSFRELKVAPGGGPRTAGITPAAIQVALAKSARRPPSTARV